MAKGLGLLRPGERSDTLDGLLRNAQSSEVIN
jgi:hypothetical protein